MLGLGAVGFSPSPPRAFATPNCSYSSLSQRQFHVNGSLISPDRRRLADVGGAVSRQEEEVAAGAPPPPPRGPYKWRMVVSYDGTKFKGWQYQPSPPTIQCFLENALISITKLDRKELCLVGAGRTDTGVHAWGQVAHFTTPFTYNSLDSMHAAINGLLPHAIRVREISAACQEFHARMSTKSKIYCYKIYNGKIMDPFHRFYAYHSAYELNPHAMREAAAHFVGRHDFTSFANASRDDRVCNPVKEILRFDITEMGAILQLEVEGTGFLYRQVRNMVALLIQVGREALPADIIPEIIAARDRKELAKVAPSAPPHGLHLMSIKYDQEVLKPPEGSPPISFGRTHQVSKCKLLSY